MSATNVIDLKFQEQKKIWQVQIEKQEVLLEAKLVILAEGAKGNLAKKIGIELNLKVMAALEYEYSQPKENPQLRIDLDAVAHGYGWNFPKADGQSLGLGGAVKGATKTLGLKQSLKYYLTRFGIGEIEKEKLFGHPIKVYSGKKKLVYQQLLLIGECGGCVDPFTVECIRPAIKSAWLAAQVVNKAWLAQDFKLFIL